MLEEILDATFPIWNEGLTRDGYARWNAAQMRTAWGKDHLHRFALLDDRGRWVASAKRYRLADAPRRGRRDDVRLWRGVHASGGARPRVRRRHHRTADRARARRRRGRRRAVLRNRRAVVPAARIRQTVPLDEVDVHVERKDGAPAMLVRAGDERDLPALAAMHDTRSSGVRFALRRDPPLIDYALSKKRLLAGLGHGAGPRAERQTEFFVAEEGVSAVAYVVLTVSAGGWTLEEAGDRDPAGARLGAILQVLLAREPSRPAPLIRAWWPPALTGAAAGPPGQPRPRARHLHAAADCEGRDPCAGRRGLLLEKRLLLMAEGLRLRAQDSA